jgi:hypothetical protein
VIRRAEPAHGALREVQISEEERPLTEAKASSGDHRERQLHVTRTGLEVGVPERLCGSEAAQVGAGPKRRVYMRMRGSGEGCTGPCWWEPEQAKS